jgi:hypothetical protein
MATKSLAREFFKGVGKFLNKPKVTLVVAFLLLFAGIGEIADTVIEEILGFEVHSAHGVIIFATSQMFVALTHILEGMEDVAIVAEAQEVKEEIDDERRAREEA